MQRMKLDGIVRVLRRAAIAVSCAAWVACGTPGAGERNTALVPASFAMDYRPDDSPAGQRIARAQQAVREAKAKPQVYAELASAFLAARRASFDDRLLAYANDAQAAAEQLAASDPDVLTVRALLLHDQHRFAQAAEVARRIAAARPDESTGPLLLGDALLEMGDYDRATEAYQKAMDILPDLRSYSRAAYVRWLHGDFDGAVELIDAALESAGPRAAEPAAWVFVDLGHMLLAKGQGEAARSAAARALQLVPGYPPALALEARTLAMQGDPQRALGPLRAALVRRPIANDLLLLAELQAELGDGDGSRASLGRAEALAAHDPVPVALYYARHRLRAQAALELATSELARRKDIYTYGAYALALLRNGRIDEAAAAMDQAERLGTPDARFALQRGLIEVRRGDWGRASAALKAARDLNPQADPILSAELERALEERPS